MNNQKNMRIVCVSECAVYVCVNREGNSTPTHASLVILGLFRSFPVIFGLFRSFSVMFFDHLVNLVVRTPSLIVGPEIK